MGYARVKLEGKWVNWKEIEKEIEKKEENRTGVGEGEIGRMEKVEGEGINKKKKNDEN